MNTLVTSRNGIQTKLLWAGVATLGAVSFGIVALNRGETISAAWLVIAALCVYFIAFRFYALFIADRVLGVDPGRQTPAYRHNASIMCRRTVTCYSVIISPPSPARARSSDPCSPLRWDICRAPYGSWPESYS